MEQIYARISAWLGPIRGRIMIGFVLIVGLYFVLAFGEQAWRARELEDEVAQRQAEITELETKRENLEQQIAEFDGASYENYVAQIARRDLNLAYPGETVMLVRWQDAPQEPEEVESDPEPSDPAPNWQQWFDFITHRS
jgi:cell division protein FtsB